MIAPGGQGRGGPVLFKRAFFYDPKGIDGELGLWGPAKIQSVVPIHLEVAWAAQLVGGPNGRLRAVGVENFFQVSSTPVARAKGTRPPPARM